MYKFKVGDKITCKLDHVDTKIGGKSGVITNVGHKGRCYDIQFFEKIKIRLYRFEINNIHLVRIKENEIKPFDQGAWDRKMEAIREQERLREQASLAHLDVDPWREEVWW